MELWSGGNTTSTHLPNTLRNNFGHITYGGKNMKKITSHVSSQSQSSERISVKVGNLQIQMDPSEIQTVQMDIDDSTVTIQTGTAVAASDSDSENPIPDETIDEGVRRVNAARFADTTSDDQDVPSDWSNPFASHSGAEAAPQEPFWHLDDSASERPAYQDSSEDPLPFWDRLSNFWHRYSEDFIWLMKTVAIVMAIICTTSGLKDIANFYQNKVAQAELEQKIQDIGNYPTFVLNGSDISYSYNVYSGRWERVKDPSEDDVVLYQLTIKYVDASTGDRLMADYQATFAAGQTYFVTSPLIQGFDTNEAFVDGIMPSADTEIAVYYRDTQPKDPGYQDTTNPVEGAGPKKDPDIDPYYYQPSSDELSGVNDDPTAGSADAAIAAADWLTSGTASNNTAYKPEGQSLPSNGPVVD